MDPNYVTGFSDGEASFTYSRNKNGESLYFAIKLTAADSDLVYKIQQFFGGIGKIYSVKSRKPQKHSGHTKAAAYWRVTKLLDLQKIVSHFDSYPLHGKKNLSFQTWKQILNLKIQNPNRALIDPLITQLSNLQKKK